MPWRGLRAALIVITLVVLVCWWPPVKQGRFAPSLSLQAFAAPTAAHALSPISIDYPDDGSIFPPGITPPTFLWRDAAGTSWNIDISFADRSVPIHAVSRGEHMRNFGPIDPDCVSDSEILRQKVESAAGRVVDLEAGSGDLESDTSPLRKSGGNADCDRLSQRQHRHFAVSYHLYNFKGRRQRAHLLPGRSANAGIGKRWLCGSTRRIQYSTHSLADPRHPQTGKPHSVERHAYLRQLSFLLGRRQDVWHLDIDGPVK